jgi:hypothetical protein
MDGGEQLGRRLSFLDSGDIEEEKGTFERQILRKIFGPVNIDNI